MNDEEKEKHGRDIEGETFGKRPGERDGSKEIERKKKRKTEDQM
jgi:hypothetical protein